jgi:hypothetical protein
MAEEYYKIYGADAGGVAGLVNLPEASVMELCDQLNVSGIVKDVLTYSKIGVEEYNTIKGRLERKIITGSEKE